MDASTASSPDVICFGETLVDFLPDRLGRKVQDVETWRPCPGGSPSNVAIGVARLGGRSAMVGTVGQDEFGQFLRRRLTEEGVDISHLRATDEGKTGLVFISLSETGERSFAFHRTRAAELFVSERDVDPAFIGSARALHFGTNSLLYGAAQRAAAAAVEAARNAGRLVCCDPNLRLHLWTNPAELRAILDKLLPSCHVLKLAQDEVEFVTGTADPHRALEWLSKKGVPLTMVTLGAEGAIFSWRGTVVRVPAPVAKVVDSTGAGDGFVAAMLYGLTRLGEGSAVLDSAGVGEIREIAAFACKVASRVVEKLGAVDGLPARAEAEPMLPAFLKDGR